MGEEGRPFPPSDHKLSQLRRDGIFPLSRDVLHAGFFLGIGISGAILTWSWPHRQLDMSAAIPRAKIQDTLAQALLTISALELQLLVPPMVFVLLLGLIQTRLRFRFGRRQKLDGVWRELTGVAKGICWGVVAFLILVSFREESPAVSALFSTFVFALAGFAVTLGALSWFVVGLQFRAVHRMSRGEIEAENRELEVKPEARQARSEFYRQ